MRVGQAAFATITTTAIATGGLAIGAAMAASPITMVALGALAAVAAAFNISSLTAWANSEPNDTAREYFERTGRHVSRVIPALFSFISQVSLQALISGIADGISRLISDKISGRHPERRRA